MQPALNKQQEKSLKAQKTIGEATIKCLYELGYAATTLAKVAEIAGLSKGALQYHFRSKEDLISAAADRLLNRSVPARKAHLPRPSLEESLMYSWDKMVNTPAYHALLEILNASRTDTELQTRISEKLIVWGKALDDHAIKSYKSVNGTDEDVRELMTMTRSFMRGLIIEERYRSDNSENEDHMKRWITMLAPHLQIRGDD